MRPFTIDQLRHIRDDFNSAQPPSNKTTVHNVLSEFIDYLNSLEPEPEPDAADALFLQGKEAYKSMLDPFRGLSKRAKEIAEKAKREGGHGQSWRDTLRGWILSGHIFAERRVGESTVRELCRLVVSPLEGEALQCMDCPTCNSTVKVLPSGTMCPVCASAWEARERKGKE